MGTSLSSIHIFGNTVPAKYNSSFRSFSPNRYSYIDSFDEKEPNASYLLAKTISGEVSDPVLHFGIFDSETILFHFFLNGKLTVKYSDEEIVSNKNLSKIPSLIHCNETQKKQLSTILNCSDTEKKVFMLEEYFGVCLLFHPELLESPNMLFRERSDKIYRQYVAEEKALIGPSAPFALKLVAEYPGKLFWDEFGKFETKKNHCFLYGYRSCDEQNMLTPVHFTGSSLAECTREEFDRDRTPRQIFHPCFRINLGTTCKVTFSDPCPVEYKGKTMTLPSGIFPINFLPSGELLLKGNHKILVADSTLRIIAKLPVKGDVADTVDNFLLTTVGDSFCGYLYEPKAKIRIYEILKK